MSNTEHSNGGAVLAAPKPGAPALITVAATAETLGVCRQTVWNLINRGELESVKIGRARRIKTASVLALINGESAA